MVERNPWYSRVKGPFPEKYGCVGVKEDGGGSMRGRGLVGKMRIHRAVFNRDADLIAKLIAEGDDVNEVEAAGNTPLHNAAYDGWCEGIELLCEHGAKLNASNNVRMRRVTLPARARHHPPPLSSIIRNTNTRMKFLTVAPLCLPIKKINKKINERPSLRSAPPRHSLTHARAHTPRRLKRRLHFHRLATRRTTGP